MADVGAPTLWQLAERLTWSRAWSEIRFMVVGAFAETAAHARYLRSRERSTATASSLCGANSPLHHTGVGRRHAGTPVLVLFHDLHIRVLSTSGQQLQDLILDPTRDHQPQAST